MGRHPCDSCGKEGWDYTETYCPNSEGGGPCDYWDGSDICPSCMVYTTCSLCSKAGCSHCVQTHCKECNVTVCTQRAVSRKRAKGEDEASLAAASCTEKVQRVHYECGHDACSVLVDRKACPACTREEQKRLAEAADAHDMDLMKELEPKLLSTRGRTYAAHFLKGEPFSAKKEKRWF